MRRSKQTLVLALALLALSGGCMFSKVRRDQKALATYGEVLGRIEVVGWEGLPIVLAAGKLDETRGRHLMVISHVRVFKQPSAFTLRFEPGRYLLGAFEDANANGRHDAGERGVLSDAFDVDDESVLPELVLTISKELARADVEQYDRLETEEFAFGDVVALDDARFTSEWALQGLWEPLAYARERHPGLYMLEPYDANKTPVVFVHGMGGYPQEFEHLIAELDNSRFQAWVYMYPSGFALEEVARVLDFALVRLEGTLGFERSCVVGHSMGGLVARRFVGLHTETEQAQSVRGLVTIASPLDGIPSAAMGVKMAPEVVAAWYDIAPDSRFLRKLYERGLPDSVEYHLLFAYNRSGKSDGTVPLVSQLRDEAQAEAEVVRGFLATHVGVLRSKSVTAQVMVALDRCRGDLDVPRIAPRAIDDPSGGIP